MTVIWPSGTSSWRRERSLAKQAWNASAQYRSAAWRTVEAPVDLAKAIADLAPDEIAVVDCLTLWLSNVFMRGMVVADECDDLAAAVQACPARLWLVSNETGLGIVPDNALARRFRDESGRLHQRLAALADHAVFVVAGLPLTLK